MGKLKNKLEHLWKQLIFVGTAIGLSVFSAVSAIRSHNPEHLMLMCVTLCTIYYFYWRTFILNPAIKDEISGGKVAWRIFAGVVVITLLPLCLIKGMEHYNVISFSYKEVKEETDISEDEENADIPPEADLVSTSIFYMLHSVEINYILHSAGINYVSDINIAIVLIMLFFINCLVPCISLMGSDFITCLVWSGMCYFVFFEALGLDRYGAISGVMLFMDILWPMIYYRCYCALAKEDCQQEVQHETINPIEILVQFAAICILAIGFVLGKKDVSEFDGLVQWFSKKFLLLPDYSQYDNSDLLKTANALTLSVAVMACKTLIDIIIKGIKQLIYLVLKKHNIETAPELKSKKLLVFDYIYHGISYAAAWGLGLLLLPHIYTTLSSEQWQNIHTATEVKVIGLTGALTFGGNTYPVWFLLVAELWVLIFVFLFGGTMIVTFLLSDWSLRILPIFGLNSNNLYALVLIFLVCDTIRPILFPSGENVWTFTLSIINGFKKGHTIRSILKVVGLVGLMVLPFYLVAKA